MKANHHFLIFMLTVAFFFGCEKIEQKDIYGLWHVVDVNVDGLVKNHTPTFIIFNKDYSFAVSQKSGDVLGLYGLSGRKLKLVSEDDRWYQGDWRAHYYKDTLVLRGLDIPYRTTYITYARIDNLPTFEEFENQVLGKWRLYKIMRSNKSEKLVETALNILSDQYQILNESGLVESGKLEIDARHQKITFVDSKVVWKAWFYGNELRLTNAELGLQYCLSR